LLAGIFLTFRQSNQDRVPDVSQPLSLCPLTDVAAIDAAALLAQYSQNIASVFLGLSELKILHLLDDYVLG